jgi:integrase
LPQTPQHDSLLSGSALREREGVSAAALEFAILTAARTGEVIGATWDEINLQSRIWSVPAARMKANKDHRVPLSSRALSILERMNTLRHDNFVFPSARVGRPLSNMAFLALLKRMDLTYITPHGFRSTFRDWTAEQTNSPHEVAEMALGHRVSNQVEAAYRRGDLFEKRQRLMERWAEYCAASKHEIIRMKERAA